MDQCNQKVTVLDHIDQIKVDGDVFTEPTNEYWAMLCMRQGLEHIHAQVTYFEKLAQKRLNPDGEWVIQGFGNLPELADFPTALLTCLFHWYAISAYQYVRIVGAIAYEQDHTCPKPLEYVASVIPDVLVFRDKVAAHFAGVSKNRRDSEAERDASLMPPIGYLNDRLCVMPFTVTKRSSGTISTSESLQPWSVTEVHQRLRDRYWPQAQ